MESMETLSRSTSNSVESINSNYFIGRPKSQTDIQEKEKEIPAVLRRTILLSLSVSTTR